MTKDTKKHAHYRPALPGARRRCGNCKFFEVEQYDRCTHVQGKIEFAYDCDWYRSNGNEQPARKRQVERQGADN